jgi:uncharacterized protein (DUF58 family)
MTATRMLDQRAIAALRRLEWQLRRRPLDTPLAGEYKSIFRGHGMEFDQVVKYTFGDDIRDVDWNVTAKLGELYRKVFVEERELSVFVVVSDDPALQFGSGGASKRDGLLQLAGLVVMLAMINRERVGMLHVRPDGTTLYPPTRRRVRVLDMLGQVFSAPPPDPAPKQRFVSDPLTSKAAQRGALVVWLGEVPQGPPPPEWAGFCKRHPVIGIRVEDAWERTGPTATDFTAYDPETHELVWLDNSPAGRAAHAAWRERREEIWRQWWPHAADRLVVDSDADPLGALVRFLRTRGGGPRAGMGAAPSGPPVNATTVGAP